MYRQIFRKKISFLTILLLAVGILTLIPAGVALADGITINTTADQDGTVPTECSLREAIQTANTNTAYGGCAHSGTPGADTLTFTPTLSGGTIVLGSQLGISSTLIISGNVPITVSGNSAVRVFEIETGGVVTLSHLSIISGSVTSVGGGGILVNDGATLRVEHCLLRYNLADNGNSGGAIQNNVGAILTVANSTFAHNRSSTAVGGGISSAGTLLLQNNTFFGNSASFGGALGVAGGSVDLRNNILGGSTANGDCARVGGTINSDVNNFIETDAAGMPCNVSTNAADLLLAPLGDYGGKTPSYALLPGSPAIDAGSNTNCPATDQRDQERPVNGTCDIGAFESQGFSFDNLGGDGQSTHYGAAFDQPLSLTVVATNTAEPVGAGGVVTFSAPLVGASITTGMFTATTSLAGGVSVPVTANGTVGSYVVTATMRGASAPALFDLTNSCDVTVVNTDDSGAGSLRQAIADVLGDVCTGGRIDFDLTLPATITLTSGELGIDVNKRRRQAIYYGGILAGLGGAFLVLGQVGSFSPGAVGGRGFIAIAAVYFGGWRLSGVLIGSYLFGLADAFRLALPSILGNVDPPLDGPLVDALSNAQFLAALPYVLTLVVMYAITKQFRQPAALSQPFIRGTR